MQKYKEGDVVHFYMEDDFIRQGTGKVVEYEELNKIYSIEVFDPVGGVFKKESEMRRAYTHISPSALQLFESNPQEAYMKYVARYKAPSIPQTQPMSVGSSFDAYVKSYIIKSLSCPKGREIAKEYEFNNLFKAQVESHNQEWALESGAYCFESYKKSGALADIMIELSQGDKEPRFEFEMKGTVKHESGEVPLLGKPDLHFVNKHGAQVTCDWKVNGYCSQSGAAPKPGYVMCRDGWAHSVAPNSKSHRQTHKNAQVQTISGIQVNVGQTLEMIDPQWSMQLATYSWLMGAPVGSSFIAGLEQLSCSPGPNGKPLIRVASFRNFISKSFQLGVYERYKKFYTALQTGYFFTDVSRGESDLKCLELEKMAKTLYIGSDDPKENWFNNMGRVR